MKINSGALEKVFKSFINNGDTCYIGYCGIYKFSAAIFQIAILLGLYNAWTFIQDTGHPMAMQLIPKGGNPAEARNSVEKMNT